MGVFTLILTAAGLSADAFAAAMCKGLSKSTLKLRHMLTVGLFFGAFQALMPLLGFYLGYAARSYVESFAPWIAFGLLTLTGAGMIREAFSEDMPENCDSFTLPDMIALSVATSIDALAAGIAFSMDKSFNNIGFTVTFIGIVTFVLSAIGVKIGNIFGIRFKSRAEIFAGMVLIALGIKALIEHFAG